MKLWVRRHKATGQIQRERPGPKPKMFTDSSSRHLDIVAMHLEDPLRTTRSTASVYGLSSATIRKHLQVAGLNCCKPAPKIPLTDTLRDVRVQFAKKYLNFDWENSVVVFSDERSFKSDKDGRKILWRRKGERCHEANFLPCGLSGQFTLRFWGWMSSMGPGELVEVETWQNSENYLDILENVMLPTVRIAYPHEHIYFVQHRTSHNASVVKEWFLTRSDISVIDWPPKSPDLNPVENLWRIMGVNWDARNVKSKEDLRQAVMSTWESMRGTDLCHNFVSGMNKRLQEIIDNGGAPICGR